MPKHDEPRKLTAAEKIYVYSEAIGQLVSDAGGRLRVKPNNPGGTLQVHIDQDDDGRPVFDFVLIKPRKN